jgi:hypothetical protein
MRKASKQANLERFQIRWKFGIVNIFVYRGGGNFGNDNSFHVYTYIVHTINLTETKKYKSIDTTSFEPW